MSTFGSDHGDTGRIIRQVSDFPHSSNNHGNTQQIPRATQINNIHADSSITLHPNDIVVGSPTQNNAIATPTNSTIVDGSTTLNNASTEINNNEIVDGRTTLNNASNKQRQHPINDIVDGGSDSNPTTVTTRQRRHRRRRKQFIQPTTVQPIPPPRPALQELQDENLSEIVRRIGNLNLGTPAAQSTLTHYGDQLLLDTSWPNPGERTYIRIYLINTNGISYYNNYLEWEMSLGFLHDMQVDIFGITEPNLDFSQPSVRYSIQEKARQVDKYMDVNLSSSKFTNKTHAQRTPFKMGGTITGINGGWSGRKNSSGTDTFNRWTWTSLNGRNGTQLTIITVYRPCATTQHGECTVYLQQLRDLMAAGIDNPNPRQHLLQDLGEFITSLHELHHTVFLMGDLNSDVQNDETITKFLQDNNLYNVITARHGDGPLPKSYDRGRNCIEIMAISATAPIDTIQRSGMLPFYFNFASDHRGFFCDLSTDWLFSRITPDTTKSTMRRFNTSRIPRCNKYLDKLETLMERSKMVDSVNSLQHSMQLHLQHGDQDIQFLISRCKILFNKMTEYMKCADRNCGKLHTPNGYPHSAALQKAGHTAYQAKINHRILSLRKQPGDEVKLEQAKHDLQAAYKSLRATQRNSIELRQEYLDDLAKKRADEWNMEACEALHIIQESEQLRQRHSKHKKFMKQSTGGAIRQLLIPSPMTGHENNLRDKKQYYTVEDPDHIFSILLQRNYSALQRSNQSIFSSGPFASDLGLHGENKHFFNDLLAGNIDPQSYNEHYPAFTGELSPFIEALKTSVQENDDEFQWDFGADEFIATFRKTRESTACGPSSLHMSHFRAATERRHIASVHAFFIWAAFRFGFSYDRWEVSWHCMLQKLQDPYVDKLRIIQLFEGDMNAGLKYLLGKLFMKHITTLQYTDSETYGSRVGKSATEAMITIQTLFAHGLVWKHTTAMVFNDAAGCYDRIPLVLAELAAVGAGCSPSIMQCHTIVQKQMKHYVKIAAGVSQGFIMFSPKQATLQFAIGILILQGIIGGIGQGGGGGPILWLLVSTIMIRALRKLCKGAEMHHILDWYKLLLWIVSYVDDNTLLRTFRLNTDPATVISAMTAMMKHWHRLLQITGGDLCLEKCKVGILAWHNNNYWGLPAICSNAEFPGDICMISDLDPHRERIQLDRIEPAAGERILGVRLALTGDMATEYHYRLAQCKTMATDLSRAPFDPLDAWMVYESRYRAAIRFPLPVTTFTTTECDAIQKPFIHALLPNLGLNRHTARALIYGPKSFAGLELMDLRNEQPQQHFLATLGHIRRQDQAGKGLLINMADTQAELGSATPFFHLDPLQYNYGVQNTRMQYLWNFVHNHKCTITHWDEWAPTPRGPHDINIMDQAVKDPYFHKKNNYRLKIINHCRLYLGAIFISDLEINGTIPSYHLDGSTFTPNPQVPRQQQLKPATTAWNEWKSFIFRNFLVYGYKLVSPSNLDSPPSAPITPRCSEIDQLQHLYTTCTGRSLEYIVSKLPASLRDILGTIDYPLDNGQAIINHVRSHTALGATDGSIINTYDSLYGGHAATIQQQYSDSFNFTSFAPSPQSTTMSSTTTELFAYISAVVMIHALIIAHDVKEGSIKLYIDNQEAGKKGEDDPWLLNTGDYLQPDYDITVLLRALIKLSPVQITAEWVASHQDELPNGQRIYGPFPRNVQLNQTVDTLAADGRNQGAHNITYRHVYSTTMLQLYSPNGTAITHLGKYLLETHNGNILRDYYYTRRGWAHYHLQLIDWEAISLYLDKQNNLRRIKVLQLQHGWQNTGSQKLQFLLSADKNHDLDEDTKRDNNVYCPFNCGHTEERLHYMHCPVPIMATKRQSLRITMFNNLAKRHTDPLLLSVLSHILTSLDNNHDPTYCETWSTSPANASIQQMFTHQSQLGWPALLQGFITTEWSDIQLRYLRTNPTSQGPFQSTKNSNTIGTWKRTFITELIRYALDSWQHRNDKLHGALDQATDREVKRALQHRVRTLYSQSKALTRTQDKRLFHVPCRLRLRYHSSLRLETWADTVELVLRQHRERVTRETLDPWLQNR